MTTFNTDGVNGVAGNFGQGLRTSLLVSINISMVVSMLTSSVGNASGQVLLSAAQELGSGLGEGTVIGLSLQPASGISTDAASADRGAIAQAFGRGLTESFLANITISNLENLFAGNTTTKVNAAKVADGFGVDLVDGIQQRIENAGGVGGILDITPAETMGMLPMPISSTFNDGVRVQRMGLDLDLDLKLPKDCCKLSASYH